MTQNVAIFDREGCFGFSFVPDFLALAVWRCEVPASAMAMIREKEASYGLAAGL